MLLSNDLYLVKTLGEKIKDLLCVADLSQRQCQVGSFARAAHLSKNNAGVLRLA